MQYGSIDSKFKGFCYVSNTKLECITKEQQNEYFLAIMIGLFVLYLIAYRITH